jgi:c-di-GMP-related signal transduction protein
MCGLDADEQYLLGMLSLLPPMLQLPMSSILPQLPLRKEMQEALGGTPNKERTLLSWIENLEEDRISGCEALVLEHNLDREKLAEIYFCALEQDANLTLTDGTY